MTMKRMLAASAALALLASPAMAQYGSKSNNSGYQTYGTGSNPRSNSVDGYTNKNGTYVQPYQRTNPNNTQYDNYNSRGNTNPYSGQTGKSSPKW